MSGTNTDPVTCVVLGFVALLELVVILPLILLYGGLVFAGRKAVELGQRRRLDAAVQKELRRIAFERTAAIRDIVEIRQRSERELRALANARGVSDE